MIQPIQYPEIPWTRDAAAGRELRADSIFARCIGCKHQVGFQSHAEFARFVGTSGWNESGTVCPVCREQHR